MLLLSFGPGDYMAVNEIDLMLHSLSLVISFFFISLLLLLLNLLEVILFLPLVLLLLSLLLDPYRWVKSLLDACAVSFLLGYPQGFDVSLLFRFHHVEYFLGFLVGFFALLSIHLDVALQPVDEPGQGGVGSLSESIVAGKRQHVLGELILLWLILVF